MMRDNIFKLADEAAKYVDGIPAAQAEPRIWRNHYNAKFAELIIGECVLYAEEFNSNIQSCSDQEIRENLNRVGKYIRSRIK